MRLFVSGKYGINISKIAPFLSYGDIALETVYFPYSRFNFFG